MSLEETIHKIWLTSERIDEQSLQPMLKELEALRRYREPHGPGQSIVASRPIPGIDIDPRARVPEGFYDHPSGLIEGDTEDKPETAQERKHRELRAISQEMGYPFLEQDGVLIADSMVINEWSRRHRPETDEVSLPDDTV